MEYMVVWQSYLLTVVAQLVAAVVARVCSSFVMLLEHASHDSA